MLTLQKWPKGVPSIRIPWAQDPGEGCGGRDGRNTVGATAMHRDRSLKSPGSLAFPLLSHSLTHYQLDLSPHYSVACEVARVVLEVVLELRFSSAIGWLGDLDQSLNTFI